MARQREGEGLADRTIEDYRWALMNHLLPLFEAHRLTEITVLRLTGTRSPRPPRAISGRTRSNKTITRLSQILGTAVEYGLIPANAAAGKRRRLKGTRPRRPWVEPEQLPSLLDAAGSRSSQAGAVRCSRRSRAPGCGSARRSALERREVNIAKGTLAVRQSKTTQAFGSST